MDVISFTSLYLITVEYQHLTSKEPTHGFDRLSFASSSWPVRVPPKAHLHGLGQSQVALIGEWSVHQLSRIPLGDTAEEGWRRRDRQRQRKMRDHQTEVKIWEWGEERVGGTIEEEADGEAKQTEDGLRKWELKNKWRTGKWKWKWVGLCTSMCFSQGLQRGKYRREFSVVYISA